VDEDREGGTLEERVAALDWYHTFDLPGGVTTPGLYDHRRVVGDLLIPKDLRGLRCLDAASADGFFAFELARRGAAEVVSVDLDDTGRSDWPGPPGTRLDADAGRARRAFGLVREVTGLDVERVDASLYELSPDTLGTFDLVFLGNILLHLRDPQRALHAIHSVTRGELVSYETISLVDTVLHPRSPAGRLWDGQAQARWWMPNLVGHRRLVEASGFRIVERSGVLLQPFGPGQPERPRRIPLRPASLAYWLVHRRTGVPSSCVRARPLPPPS
jgi:tRNA (mo5U34)-methyltransferase